MIWTFGEHELDDGVYQLRRRGRPVPMEPRVFDVLLYLVRHRDRVVSKGELLDELWSGAAVSDSVLPRCIARARRALQDDPSRQRAIQTVHGRGYRFVAEAIEDDPPSRRDARPDTVPPTRPDEPKGFVGRKIAMSKLRKCLAEVQAGRGRIALLVGEPGIGKTRTAEELANEAEGAGARWLAARCHEGEGAPAFWPWLQVLRALLTPAELDERVPELGRAGAGSSPGFEGEQMRFRLFDAIARLLSNAARQRPLLITIDDLHWADPDSLRLLEFLAAELRNEAVLLLASYRDVEVRRDHALRRLLGALARQPHCEHIALRGLERAEVAALIDTLAGGTPCWLKAAKVLDASHSRTRWFARPCTRSCGRRGAWPSTVGWARRWQASTGNGPTPPQRSSRITSTKRRPPGRPTRPSHGACALPSDRTLCLPTRRARGTTSAPPKPSSSLTMQTRHAVVSC